MKTSLGYGLSFLNGLIEGLANAGEMGSAVLLARDPTNLTIKDYAGAYSFGILTGLIYFTSSYCFQGAEIRKRVSDDYDSEYEELDEEQEEEYSQPSRKKISAYLFTKYFYIVSALIVDYLAVSFLYSATKAWISDLNDDEDIPLTFVSHTEGALLLLYYLFLDLPFVLTSEIPQTCKEIREIFKITPSQAPDTPVINKMLKYISPFANNQYCRKLIRISGSIFDTIEHITPLVIIIPTKWILDIKQSTPLIAWGAASGSVAVLSLITGTILTQTYLFEGRFSEQNLKAVASHFGNRFEPEEPWINSKIAKVFDKLLYFGGPLHGVDTGLSILLTLRELNAERIFVISATVIGVSIPWLGNHFSEVYVSQTSLKKMTRHSDVNSARNKSSCLSLFFKKKINEVKQTEDKPRIENTSTSTQENNLSAITLQ